jgi:hypothetical protein
MCNMMTLNQQLNIYKASTLELSYYLMKLSFVLLRIKLFILSRDNEG